MQHSEVWQLACLVHCLEHNQIAVSLRTVCQGLDAHPLFKIKQISETFFQRHKHFIFGGLTSTLNEQNEPFFITY